MVHDKTRLFYFAGLEDDREFPVEILPHLFLGNAANSEDSQALLKHSIQVRNHHYSNQ